MKLSKNRAAQKGFTLVELAIVLVIIGLIVGGVLAGQDLIKSAKLQKSIKLINDTNTAANTFMGKYGQLPGDYSNALQLTTPIAIAGVVPGTLGLGDGNGVIQAVTTAQGGTATATVGASGETAAFFQELYDAGLFAQPMAAISLASINTPQATINSTTAGIFASFGAESPSALLIVQGFPAVAQGNYMFITGQATGAAVAGIAPFARALTPLSSQSIDGKLDDGQPGSGNITVVAQAPVAGTLDVYGPAACASSPTSYNIGLKTQLCTLAIKTSF